MAVKRLTYFFKIRILREVERTELSSMTEVTAFAIGFKLGLRLTAEAFIGGNDEQELTSE